MEFDQNSLGENNEKKDNKWTMIIILIVVVLTLTGVIIFTLLYFNKDKSLSNKASSEADASKTTEITTIEDNTIETTEASSEVTVEPSTESTENSEIDENKEVITEETTEISTEENVDETDSDSHRTEIPDGGLLWEMVGGGSYYVPDGFENITQEVYAVRYVQEFQNYDLDMYLTVTNTTQTSIPMSLDEEYEYYYNAYEATLSLNKKESDGYILSGTTDAGRIYYNKVKIVGDRYVSFHFDYPAENSDTCNPIVEEFVSNFSYPD